MEAGDGYWWTQLDEEVDSRLDQPEYHLFAEGMHSDIRGQVLNLRAGGELTPPDEYAWDAFVHIFLGVNGEMDVTTADRVFHLRPMSQLVLLPGQRWSIASTTDAAVEIISLRSSRPHG